MEASMRSGSPSAAALRSRPLSIRTKPRAAPPAAAGADESATEGEPLSPTSRLVENLYIVVTIGLGSRLNRPAFSAGIARLIAPHPRFNSIQVTDGSDDGNPRWVRVRTTATRLLSLQFLLPKVATLFHQSSYSSGSRQTVNDVLIGVTSAALSRYYFRKSGDTNTKDIFLRSVIAVNTRPLTSLQVYADMIESGKNNEAAWGNQIGYILLRFHLAMCNDPLAYVRKAKKTMDRKKNSLEVAFTHKMCEFFLNTFGLKGGAFIFGGMAENTTIAFSNMVGPTEQIDLYGHPVVFIAPSVYGVPQPVIVHYQSYDRIIKVILSINDQIFPDYRELLDDFAVSFGDIMDAASKIST